MARQSSSRGRRADRRVERETRATQREPSFAFRRPVPLVLVSILSLAAMLGLALWWRQHQRQPAPAMTAAVGSTSASSSSYVGSAACAACHAPEAAAWRGSRHAAAMADATEESVRGRFDGARFTQHGVTSTFSKRGDKFIVKTDGPDGRVSDFEVAYTFGAWPLQQYLIALPGGRLQALGIAWDARPLGEGGQRWYSLYPNDAVKAGDPLHWTGRMQNWNFMCADCHSTNVRKRYDAPSRTFATTWSEISVGCEACHGPGSAHVGWAKRHVSDAAPKEPESANDPYANSAPVPHSDASAATAMKLTVRLDERHGVHWSASPSTGQPVRSVPRESDREIEVCARCHARRGQITDDVRPGEPFENFFRATLLVPPLYYADGQQRDEVYTYASFAQSRMAARGVTCSDCHDPHAARLRLPGNAICTQCHAAAYDTPTHTMHARDTAAAACPTCHMPSTTYMGIDRRPDHGFRIPRPDLTVRLGVPNACTGSCHANRTAAWAAARIDSHRSRVSTGTAASSRTAALAPRPDSSWTGVRAYTEAFAGVERDNALTAVSSSVEAQSPLNVLVAVARDRQQSAIVRASALERMAKAGMPLESPADFLRDASPLIRRAALDAWRSGDIATRIQLITPLLGDPIRTVRSQAALGLLDVPAAALTDSDRAAFDRALAEFVNEQRFNGDRPEAQTTLGMVLIRRGRIEDAMTALREAITLDRTYVPAFVNLADVYRQQGREAEAERLLRAAIAANPSAAATAHHALGLALVRQRRTIEAVPELAAAARLAPEDPLFAYVHAVALHDTGHADQAIRILDTALARHPRDRDILEALVTYTQQAQRPRDAERYAARLAAVDGARERRH